MHRTRQVNERSRSQHARRRRNEKQNLTSSQLVVFNPPKVQDHKSKRHHRQRVSDDPKEPRRGVAIHNGDVRAAYKVLPIIIGTGSFGTVRACIHRESRTKLAIKSIAVKGHAGNATLLKNEISLLGRANHRNIVKIVDVMQDQVYIHIIMEQCRGGDLFDLTVDDKTRLSEGRIRHIIGSLLDAIEHLHSMNIVHRDLKAEHLMFSSNDVNSVIKIIDFGVATLHKPGDDPLTAFAGSLRSVAPEVVKRCYGRECDLWSVGIITYFLLIQKMPFNGQSQNEIFKKIVTGKFYYPQWAATGISEESKHFIDCLLVVDPKKRLTVRQALTHPWIRNKRIGQQTQAPVPQPATPQIESRSQHRSRGLSRSRSQSRGRSQY